MSDNSLLIASVAGIVLLGPVGLYSHSLYSGWSKMAKRFRVASTPRPTMGFGVMSIGVANRAGNGLDGSARLTLAPEGLYLSMPWLLRFLHPTLLIPWDALSVAPLADYMSATCQKLLIRDGTYLIVTDKAYLQMQQYLPAEHNRKRPEWAMGQLF